MNLIGNTPLVYLAHFGVFAKLESRNLTGSAKDRAALAMIEAANLKPGACIIEPTSGNTGISIAAIAAQRGFRAILVMPSSASRERIKLMEAYGAQVVLTPAEGGMTASIEMAQKIAAEHPGSVILNQFDNPANALAHYRSTGPEIWAQSAGKIDIFVCATGTGGTITGTGRYLKEQDPNVCIVAVEPAESPVLSGGKAGLHGIQGIGAGFIPKVLDTALLDEIVAIPTQEAYACARRLAKAEGILAGISSGAALAAAEKIARENPGKTVVTLLPDGGERYLSTELWRE